MKRIRWIALLLLAAILSFCLAACQKSVELVGWTDGSASAELGSIYEFRDLTAEDTDGNTYTATVSLRDSADQPVELISNRFTVTDMGGYTAVYSVTLENGDVRTRTVQISVVDNGKPVVVLGAVANGTVNEEYALPEITVMDQSGEEIEPEISVSLIDGENRVEQQVSGSSFTPAQRGEYELKVTATDSSGNTGEALASFKVRAPMKAQALEDFDDPYSVENSTNFARGLTTEEPRWLEEFEGRTGVVTSVNGDDNSWADYAFRFNMTQKELSEIDFAYISVWVWLDCATPVTLNQRNIPYASVPGRTWTEIRLTPDMIAGGADMSWFMDANLMLEGETPRDTFDRLMTQEGGFNLFGQGSGADKSITVYVDEITYMRSYTPVFSGKTEVEVGEEVVLATEIPGVTGYEETFAVVDPLGQEVELSDNRFTPEIAGEYTVTAAVSDENGIGSAQFVIRAVADRSIVVEEYTGQPVAGDTVIVPEGYVVDREGERTDETLTVTVTRYGKEIAVTDGEFVAADGGEYRIEYSFTYEGTEIVRVLNIDVTFPAPGTLPDNLAGRIIANSSFLAKDENSGYYFEDEGETIVLYAKHPVGTSVEMIDFSLPDLLKGAGGYRYSFRVKIGNYQAEGAFFQVRLRDADNNWTAWGQSHQGSVVFGGDYVDVSGYLACTGDPGYLSIELYTGAVLSSDEEVIVRLSGLSVEKTFEVPSGTLPEGVIGTATANSYLMQSEGALFFEKDGETDVAVVEILNLAGAYPAVQFTFAPSLPAGQYTFRVQMKAENYTHQDIAMVLLNGENAVATAYPAWGDKTVYSSIEFTFTVNSEITGIRFDLTPSSIADASKTMRWWIKDISYEKIVPSFVQQTENVPGGIIGTAKANSYLAEGKGSLTFEKDGEEDVALIQFVGGGNYPAVQFELPSALIAGKYKVSVQMKAENYAHQDMAIVLLGDGAEIGWSYPAWGDKSQYSTLQAEFEVSKNLTSIRFDITPGSISDPSVPMKWWIKNIVVEAVAPSLAPEGTVPADIGLLGEVSFDAAMQSFTGTYGYVDDGGKTALHIRLTEGGASWALIMFAVPEEFRGAGSYTVTFETRKVNYAGAAFDFVVNDTAGNRLNGATSPAWGNFGTDGYASFSSTVTVAEGQTLGYLMIGLGGTENFFAGGNPTEFYIRNISIVKN